MKANTAAKGVERVLGFSALGLGIAILCLSGVSAQTTRFFYDNLGRLAVVADTNGTDAAVWQYDAVGNITSIVRTTLSDVDLLIFSPSSGSGNQTITLQGIGFETNPAQNTVVFGSITAQVTSATANQLQVLVPTNAVSSLISVITPSGGATNSTTFTAGIGVQITPSSVSMYATASTQLVATVYGTNDQRVTWYLNGWIPAGTNTSWGTVTTNGLYTAPLVPPPAEFAEVQARSVADPNPLQQGNVTISIAPAPPLEALFTAAPTNGFMPLSVTFTDTSTGVITNRFWEFGDGATTNTTSTNFVYTYIIYPPGDVNHDGHVTGADSLLINQVLTGMRQTNDPIFETNFTVQLVVDSPLTASTNTCTDCIVMGCYPNGDVNNSGTVTGADTLLINQVMVGLRSYIMTKTVPGSRTNDVPTDVAVYGIGFPTATVSAITIQAPVNLSLTNLVMIKPEQINALVPSGGGTGTGVVWVTASPSNSVLSFSNFENQ